MKNRSNRHKSNKGSAENFDPAKFKEESDLSNKAVQKFLENTLREKISKKQDIDALVHTIQEFLNCFVILGYTLDGLPVNIISAHSQQEADSLATLVNKTFMQQQNHDRDSS
jgi:hypothetical protein